MTPEEKNVEMWRIKKLIKTLENARGYLSERTSLRVVTARP